MSDTAPDIYATLFAAFNHLIETQGRLPMVDVLNNCSEFLVDVLIDGVLRARRGGVFASVQDAQTMVQTLLRTMEETVMDEVRDQWDDEDEDPPWLN